MKHLYCPECKNYPDTVTVEVEATEKRRWDGECYELIDTEIQEEQSSYCGKCSTLLVDNTMDRKWK